jgi:hypothetical protein
VKKQPLEFTVAELWEMLRACEVTHAGARSWDESPAALISAMWKLRRTCEASEPEGVVK